MKERAGFQILFIVQFILASLFSATFICCNAQTNRDHTQELEPFYIGMPDNIDPVDTSVGWRAGSNRILLTGKVYQADGLTPAADVILYYYHTDLNGRYIHDEKIAVSMPPNKEGHSHGHLRGWVKSDAHGNYSIYTSQPNAYPSGDEAAHVHITVLDSQMNKPYYLDDFVFDHDPLLTTERRNKMTNRGGSGVLRMIRKADYFIGERNIILGLNVPEYSQDIEIENRKGLKVGEDLSSFAPLHVWGIDEGKTVCPICKYGWYHGVLFFANANTKWEDIAKWLEFLEKESEFRQGYLKVYLVYSMDETPPAENVKNRLVNLGLKLNLEHVALTVVPSFQDAKSKIDRLELNSDLTSTIILYRRSNIIASYNDLPPSDENFAKIKFALDRTLNDYFYAPKASPDNR